VDRLLALIPALNLPNDTISDDTLLSAAIVLVQQICEVGGSTRVRRALLEGLVRTVETYLLSDARLLEVSRYWDSYLGREREVIKSRVSELLGVEPNAQLIEHLRACVQARTWQNPTDGTATRPTQRAVSTVFERVAQTHPRHELRCASCGYHFREGDMGTDRLEMTRDFRLALAPSIDPRRKEDPLKAVLTSGDRPRSLTELTIDHVVPLVGFGSSEPENLRFLCQFCNGGKLGYRRPLEPFSALVAASLSGFPLNRPHSLLRQLVVASSIAAAGGRCERCDADVIDRELTVRLHADDVPHRWWLVPWNMVAVCYECWSS
jgi:5-methylcytosine-specific restriction endonuclease McrA